ncbi:MAG: glycosyltransferase [Parcubacteria group bacterium]|nr:glycosyltransferase [Parcubacteria group bacterium]
MPKFSLIIPTYNRPKILIDNLKKLRFDFPEAEIIVVDDGSQTEILPEIKKEFGGAIIYIKNEKNLGKGASLRKGFLMAQGDYLIFTDDDLPYGTPIIKLILEQLNEGHSIVIGQRDFFSDSFFKKLGRLTFNAIFKPLLGIKIKDTQAGIKGFKVDVGKKLFQLSFTNRFAIDLEILYLAQKFNIPISTIFVQTPQQQLTTFSWLDTLNIALDVFKIIFHHYEKNAFH